MSSPTELASRCKAALSARAMADAGDLGVVRLQGLPFVADRRDVERLVTAGLAARAEAEQTSASPVAQLRATEAIFLPSTPERRPSGDAFAVFDGGAEAAPMDTSA